MKDRYEVSTLSLISINCKTHHLPNLRALFAGPIRIDLTLNRNVPGCWRYRWGSLASFRTTTSNSTMDSSSTMRFTHGCEKPARSDTPGIRNGSLQRSKQGRVAKNALHHGEEAHDCSSHHTMSVDPRTRLVYLPLENVNGRAVLVFEPMR